MGFQALLWCFACHSLSATTSTVIYNQVVTTTLAGFDWDSLATRAIDSEGSGKTSHTNIRLESCRFTNIKPQGVDRGGAVFAKEALMSVWNCRFEVCGIKNIQGGAICITCENTKQGLEVLQSKFVQCGTPDLQSDFSSGGAIYCEGSNVATSIFSLKESQFSSCTAYSGGCLYSRHHIECVSCNFSECKAGEDWGSAMYCEWSFTVANSQFNDMVGGCLRLDARNPGTGYEPAGGSEMDIRLENCRFLRGSFINTGSSKGSILSCSLNTGTLSRFVFTDCFVELVVGLETGMFELTAGDLVFRGNEIVGPQDGISIELGINVPGQYALVIEDNIFDRCSPESRWFAATGQNPTYTSLSFINNTFDNVQFSATGTIVSPPESSFSGKLTISTCKFLTVTWTSAGILTAGSTAVVLDGCLFQHCTSSGDGIVSIDRVCNDITVKSCEFVKSTCSKAPLVIKRTSGQAPLELTGCKFSEGTQMLSIVDGTTTPDADIAVTFNDCWFQNNQISSATGLVELTSSQSVVYENCHFVNNVVNQDCLLLSLGCKEGSVRKFVGCEFSSCTVAAGGLITCQSSISITIPSLTLEACTFAACTAAQGILSFSNNVQISTIKVTDCSFDGINAGSTSAVLADATSVLLSIPVTCTNKELVLDNWTLTNCETKQAEASLLDLATDSLTFNDIDFGDNVYGSIKVVTKSITFSNFTSDMLNPENSLTFQCNSATIESSHFTVNSGAKNPLLSFEGKTAESTFEFRDCCFTRDSTSETNVPYLAFTGQGTAKFWSVCFDVAEDVAIKNGTITLTYMDHEDEMFGGCECGFPSDPPPPEQKTGLPGGAIAGIVIGILIVIAVVVVVVLLLLRRRNIQNTSEKEEEATECDEETVTVNDTFSTDGGGFTEQNPIMTRDDVMGRDDSFEEAMLM